MKNLEKRGCKMTPLQEVVFRQVKKLPKESREKFCKEWQLFKEALRCDAGDAFSALDRMVLLFEKHGLPTDDLIRLGAICFTT